MDTSETYVKMCECEELYQHWQPKEGDWFWVRGRNAKGEPEILCLSSLTINSDHQTIYIPILEPLHATFKLEEKLPSEIPISINKQTYTKFPLRYFVWLPRQDQLQAMLYPARYKEKYDMCSAFAARCTFSVFNAFISDKPDVMSMEQLWLAFVMIELHQKRWHNGEWVDDTRNP